jgi:hypothetical protein
MLLRRVTHSGIDATRQNLIGGIPALTWNWEARSLIHDSSQLSRLILSFIASVFTTYPNV